MRYMIYYLWPVAAAFLVVYLVGVAIGLLVRGITPYQGWQSWRRCRVARIDAFIRRAELIPILSCADAAALVVLVVQEVGYP